MSNWKECFSRASSSARISDPGSFTSRSELTSASPIDLFHESILQIIRVANPDFLSENAFTGPLFLGGVVAATEEYLRSIIGRFLTICPDAQKEASGQMIPLGSAMWHGQSVFARGALEHASLASKTNVVNTVKKFLGYQIVKTDRVWGVLEEYEKVCQIRHGVVHSGCIMPGKNAFTLGLIPAGGTPALSVGFRELQECAEVCTSFAVSLNLDLFGVLTDRWATTWRDCSSWSSCSDTEHFRKIWTLFYCNFDKQRGQIVKPLSMIRCRNAIKKQYSL